MHFLSLQVTGVIDGTHLSLHLRFLSKYCRVGFLWRLVINDNEILEKTTLCLIYKCLWEDRLHVSLSLMNSDALLSLIEPVHGKVSALQCMKLQHFFNALEKCMLLQISNLYCLPSYSLMAVDFSVDSGIGVPFETNPAWAPREHSYLPLDSNRVRGEEHRFREVCQRCNNLLFGSLLVFWGVSKEWSAWFLSH